MVTDYQYHVEALIGSQTWVEDTMKGGVTDWFGGAAGWDNYTPDAVIGEPVVVEFGIVGNKPDDCVASTGSLSCLMNNDVNNSAKKIGYYSPYHVNRRPGFDYNIPVRLRLNYDSVETIKFYGSLAEIIPIVEEFHSTTIKALDIFDDYARIDEPEIPTQFNKRADEILDAIIDALDTKPPTRSFEAGVETYQIALDGGTGQKLKVRERINQLCLSERGYSYPKGMELVFENRHHRAANPVVKFILSDADILLDGSFTVLGARSDFYKSVKVTVHPTNNLMVEPISVLYALKTTRTQIRGGETNDTIFGPYHNEETDQQVGGTEQIAPIPYTDFTMNVLADGTGTDLTSFFTVTASATASGVRFTITNNGIDSGFVTMLQLRGKAIFRYEADVNQKVPGKYGEQTLELDMPFQNNTNVAKDVADFFASIASTPFANLPPVTFIANADKAHLKAAFELWPGDRIAISQSTVGLTLRNYTINSVRLTFTGDGPVYCTWGLEPASMQRFWIMGQVGSGEMGINTFFGF